MDDSIAMPPPKKRHSSPIIQSNAGTHIYGQNSGQVEPVKSRIYDELHKRVFTMDRLKDLALILGDIPKEFLEPSEPSDPGKKWGDEKDFLTWANECAGSLVCYLNW